MRRLALKKSKFVLGVILIIVIFIFGFLIWKYYQFSNGVLHDTQKMFEEKKAYILNLSFSGVVIDKAYNVDYKRNQYLMTISLDQLTPKPLSISDIEYPTYYTFVGDSLLKLCIPQDIYDRIKEGDTIIKKAENYNIEIGKERMEILSPTKNKWLP